MASRRLPPDTEQNALNIRLQSLRAAGVQILDLTESNPTRAGIAYPQELLAGLADQRGLCYEPHPLGLESARTAVAAEYERRGLRVDPRCIVLTASTSEAYSWLFKLLCDPGDAVLVPQPSYPLFEHLTRLDGVRTQSYELEYHHRWEIDFGAIRSAAPETRALLVVSPNNPTGSYICSRELAQLAAICEERQWAIIVDEVFVDYPLDESSPLTDIALRTDGLCFTLGGLSKSCGLPQLKLGWIVTGGEPSRRASAMAALELIADSYLSVNTPVQLALGSIFASGSDIRVAIQERIRRNLNAARQIVQQFKACEVLRTEGGWSAVIRVPATRTEEDLALTLLEREHILIHPGYFFDFPREAYLVASLLPEPEIFTDGMTRVLRVAGC